MKAVCYAATRNLYSLVPIAIFSLLKTNPEIERVILLIEDDVFPLPMDEKIEIFNVAKLTQYLDPKSPNYKTVFTYMSLVRLCLPKWFPELDAILYLDVDTVITGSLSQLWEMDMDGYFVASCPELVHRLSTRPEDMAKMYINSGVSFFNLKYLRESGMCDNMLNCINSGYRYQFCDQDVINICCEGKIFPLDCKFNSSVCCGVSDQPNIVHYAGFKLWWQHPDCPQLKYWYYWADRYADEELKETDF